MSKTGAKRPYKAMYHFRWEKNPILKDWIQSVPGKPDKAFCRYCQRLLYAHRYSVVKHACTMKHQQNADKFRGKLLSSDQVSDFQTVPNSNDKVPDPVTTDLNSSRDVKIHQHDEEIVPDTSAGKVAYPADRGHCEVEIVFVRNSPCIGVMPSENSSALVKDEREDVDEDPSFGENDTDGEAKCEKYHFVETVEEVSTPPALSEADMPSHKSLTISTHILDTSCGKAAAKVPVTLFKYENNTWNQVNLTVTNTDGRVPALLPNENFTTGLYKLNFNTKEYFEQTTTNYLYPFVDIVFNCTENGHYHIPLLLNPFGYSTYRGT